MFLDLRNQLKLSAFTSKTAQVNLLVPSPATNYKCYVYGGIVMPRMVVAHLTEKLCFISHLHPKIGPIFFEYSCQWGT